MSTIFQVILPFAILVYLHIRGARYRVREWASQNGFVILQLQLRLWDTGPFSVFGGSGGQYIFRISVIDKNTSRRRTGFVRVGGYFGGLLRRRVEVKWDKQSIFTSLSD